MTTLTNQELANTFRSIADLMEIKGENIYKILAYRKAADSLSNLGQDINEIWKQGKLTEVDGVGKAIAEKIDELLSTGHLEFLDKAGSRGASEPGRGIKSPRPRPQESGDVLERAGHNKCE